MTSFTEANHPGEFIVDEPSTKISREVVTVTVAAATKLEPGHVLGKIAVGGKYVDHDNAGSDGSEAAAGILYGECDNTDGVGAVDFTAVAVTRLAAVRKGGLKWNSGVDAAGKTAAYADLAALMIIAVDL